MAKKKTSSQKVVLESSEVPAPPRIAFEDLQKQVIDGTITEAEMEAYFVEVPPQPGELMPQFVLNPELVKLPPEETGLESALILNTANAWCYMMRRHEYYRRINRPGGNQLIRILAEGDSWFQYPVKLDDVIDHISARKDVAVRCFSAAGDVLSNMVARPQFLDAIRTEKPKYFLLSGGGNDLVDGEGLRLLLKPYDPALKPAQYLNDAYTAFKARISRLYADVFDMIYREDPTIHIICHGYSYAIPDSDRGPWLGKAMEDKKLKITDRALQFKIMKIIVDDINKAITAAASAAKGKVTFLDNRQLVPADGWYDEFHPTSEWFGKVAATFNAVIQ